MTSFSWKHLSIDVHHKNLCSNTSVAGDGAIILNSLFLYLLHTGGVCIFKMCVFFFVCVSVRFHNQHRLLSLILNRKMSPHIETSVWQFPTQGLSLITAPRRSSCGELYNNMVIECETKRWIFCKIPRSNWQKLFFTYVICVCQVIYIPSFF